MVDERNYHQRVGHVLLQWTLITLYDGNCIPHSQFRAPIALTFATPLRAEQQTNLAAKTNNTYGERFVPVGGSHRRVANGESEKNDDMAQIWNNNNNNVIII